MWERTKTAPEDFDALSFVSRTHVFGTAVAHADWTFSSAANMFCFSCPASALDDKICHAYHQCHCDEGEIIKSHGRRYNSSEGYQASKSHAVTKSAESNPKAVVPTDHKISIASKGAVGGSQGDAGGSSNSVAASSVTAGQSEEDPQPMCADTQGAINVADLAISVDGDVTEEIKASAGVEKIWKAIIMEQHGVTLEEKIISAESKSVGETTKSPRTWPKIGLLP